MRGYTAKVGLRKPGTLAWARAQLNDPHLTTDEWDEFIEYQSAHLTPAQVDAFAPWFNHAEPIPTYVDDDCRCGCETCIRQPTDVASYEPNGRYDAMRDIWWTGNGWVTGQRVRRDRIRSLTTSYHSRKRGWKT